MANSSKSRRTFTDLSAPQQVRELNRQMEWVWGQLLGGLTEKSMSSGGIRSFVETVEKTIATEISSAEITTNILKAALTDLMVAQIGIANIDFTKIIDASLDEMIFRVGVGEELYIDRLTVTSAMLLSATLGKLIIKGEDGLFYDVCVRMDGSISATPVEVTPDEESSGVSHVGRELLETNINVQDLNAQDIHASSAIINEILTSALTAGKITAADAMIASATIPQLYTTSIESIGDSLTFTGNKVIRLLVETDDNLRAWFNFTENGLLIGKAESAYNTLTDESGFHIQQNGEGIGSFAKRQLDVESINVGPMKGTSSRQIIIRGTASGGVVFVAEDAT